MWIGTFRIGSLQSGGGIYHLGKFSRWKSQISWNNMASQSPRRNCGFKSWSAIWATNWSQIRLDENQYQARSNDSETNLSFLRFLGSNCIIFGRNDEYFSNSSFPKRKWLNMFPIWIPNWSWRHERIPFEGVGRQLSKWF